MVNVCLLLSKRKFKVQPSLIIGWYLFEIRLRLISQKIYAVFALKYPSLLSFEKDYYEGNISKSCNGLFGIKNLPSDTHLRDVMDLVDDKDFRRIFKKLFTFTQRSKTLERFEFLKLGGVPHYLIAGDGSGYFSSKKLQCSVCTIYHEDNEDKETRFGHQIFAASIVHPDQREVLPLCPEPVYKEDGMTKNDCEFNAFKRFMEDFKREHPKLKTIFLGDALYSNGPAMKLLEDNGMYFLLNIKTNPQRVLGEFRDKKKKGLTGQVVVTEKTGVKIIKTIERAHRFLNDMRFNQNDGTRINFIELVETKTWTDKDGEFHRERKIFTWITNILIDTKNVEQLAKGARTRWKIENETFNTLKNHGYNLEHNYGHGKNNLSKNLINMMFIAFYIDQLQYLSCTTFKRVVDKLGAKTYIWRKLKGLIELIALPNWEITYGIYLKEVKLEYNSS